MPNRKKGFTLIEIVVALGILSFLAVGGLALADLLNKSTAPGDEGQNLESLVSTVRERLKYGDLCTDTIGSSSTLNQSGIDRAELLLGQQQIELRIPGINAGGNGTDEILRTGQVLPGRKLRIDQLRLINASLVSGDTYVAQISVASSTFSNRTIKPVILGSVQFSLTGPPNSSSIAECAGDDSGVPQEICTSMNCEWITNPSPRCRCETVSSLCPVGEYPTSFLPTGPVCAKLGGACPPGEYLVGVGLGRGFCAPIAAAPVPAPPVPPVVPPPVPGPVCTVLFPTSWLVGTLRCNTRVHPPIVLNPGDQTTILQDDGCFKLGFGYLPNAVSGGCEGDLTVRCDPVNGLQLVSANCLEN